MFFGKTLYSWKGMIKSTITSSFDMNTAILQNAIFDSFYGTTSQLSLEEWNGELPNTWGFGTRIYAEFKGNLYGGNVAFSEKNVEKIRIKKKTKNDTKFQTIYEKTIEKAEDFKVNISDYYEPIGEVQYAYVPVMSGAEGEATISTVQSEFDTFFICERDVSYPITLDLDFSKQLNQKTGVIEVLGRRYPIVVKNGNLRYYSGNITCTFVQPCYSIKEFNQAWDYRNVVYDFLTDGRPKILKDDLGNAYMIMITGDAITEDSDHRLHVKSKFDFTEVGDAYSTSDLYYNNFIDVDYDG